MHQNHFAFWVWFRRCCFRGWSCVIVFPLFVYLVVCLGFGAGEKMNLLEENSLAIWIRGAGYLVDQGIVSSCQISCLNPRKSEITLSISLVEIMHSFQVINQNNQIKLYVCFYQPRSGMVRGWVEILFFFLWGRLDLS